MAGNDVRHGRGDGSGAASEGDLSRRLERLGAELEARRPAAPLCEPHGASASNASGLARGFRASAEFVAGIVGGGGFGWVFDKGLGTSPWGLIVFLLLGFVAGVYNVLRSAGLPAPTARVGDAPKLDR